MTDISKLTKAHLAAKISELEKALRNAESAIPPVAARVPEAEALAGCIRALDALNGKTSSNFGYAFAGAGSNSYSRILRALADKYDVPLIQYVPTKPVDLEGNF